jgi:hypothetical protein
VQRRDRNGLGQEGDRGLWQRVFSKFALS